MTKVSEDSGLKSTKTVTGLPENTEAALCYVGFWLTGLIFLIMSQNKTIKFHALQSLVVFGCLYLLMAIPVIGWMLSPILWIVIVGLWLFLSVKAYQGEMVQLPIVSDFVKQQLGGKK